MDLGNKDDFASFLEGFSDDDLSVPLQDTCNMSPLPFPEIDIDFYSPHEQEMPTKKRRKDSSSTRQSRSVKPMNSSTRQKRKDEISSLRKEAEELEAQLDTIKQQFLSTWSYGQPLVSSENHASIHNQVTTTSQLWKRVARHQLVERQNAVRRNRRLREKVVQQQQLAGSIGALLHHPSVKEEHEAKPYFSFQPADLSPPYVSASSKTTPMPAPFFPPKTCSNGLVSAFEKLHLEADEKYAQVDDVWKEVGIHFSRHEMVKAYERTNQSTRPYIEVIHTKIFPFPLQETCGACWWMLSLQDIKLSHGVYHSVSSSDDTIAACTSMRVQTEKLSTTLYIDFLVKKYQEEERVVFVVESSARSDCTSEPIVGPIRKGWVVFRQEESIHGPVTVCELCMRSSPVDGARCDGNDEREKKSGKKDMEELKRICLERFYDCAEKIYQYVENVLVDAKLPTREGSEVSD